MWNPTTAGQSTSVRAVSASRKGELRVPVANITLAWPRAFDRGADRGRGVRGRVATKILIGLVDPDRRAFDNQRPHVDYVNLREPSLGGREHLVGSWPPARRSRSARRAVDEHRFETRSRSPLIAASTVSSWEVLTRCSVLRPNARGTGATSRPLTPAPVHDAHALDHRVQGHGRGPGPGSGR